MEDKIQTLVASALNIPASQVTDELAMKDVEAWDSLKHMELIVALEDGFATQFSFEEIVAMQSVGDIRRILNGKGSGG